MKYCNRLLLILIVFGCASYELSVFANRELSTSPSLSISNERPIQDTSKSNNAAVSTRELVQQVIAAWQSGDLAAFDQLYAPMAQGAINQATQLNYADIKNRFIYVAAHNTNRQFKVSDLVVEKDTAVLFFQYSAYDTLLKEKIVTPVMWLFKIRNGKIIHVDILTPLHFNYKKKS